ncbi:MAG: NAD(P)/FAD-dependent oxidoreductase [Candidatus Altimarinota bacterium]
MESPNSSPWLRELKSIRPTNVLEKDVVTEVVIVGGGIAGMASAFYILRDTKKKVLLLEAGKIANGATGHNAGQLVAEFEKSFTDIAKEYGADLACRAQDELLQTWDLIDEIFKEGQLKTPYFKFAGHYGLASVEEILEFLSTKKIEKEYGLKSENLLVADLPELLSKIPAEYKEFYVVIPHKKVLVEMETNNKNYIAYTASLKGCMNSALFTEELAGYLLNKYPDRFELYEKSKVDKLVLKKKGASLLVGGNLVDCQRVVLCTNGFEQFKISNMEGKEIDAKYHENVYGIVGYMAGYKENSDKPPGALAYFSGKTLNIDDPYFYLTRRPYQENIDNKYNLVCIGGPETRLPDYAKYNRENTYPTEAKQSIDEFIKKNLKLDVKDNIEYRFFWHGLMGYTKNGLRMIGPDPCNRVLLYNLGCNGIGIIPSILGGKKVAQFLTGKKMRKSVFDPFKDFC